MLNLKKINYLCLASASKNAHLHAIFYSISMSLMAHGLPLVFDGVSFLFLTHFGTALLVTPKYPP